MLLDVRGLQCRYGRIQVLHGIDLEVDEGELVALVGANGAGKTTLLRTLSGIEPASGGAISFNDKDITRYPSDMRVRHGIVQVPEGRQMFSPMSVEDNLLIGGYTRSDSERNETLEQVYAMFPMLKERRHSAAGNLSGGQQQMLAISRALMARPRLLLLDEPSMGLSPLLVDEVFATIQKLRDGGTTIFLVEQNAYMALAIADRGYVLEAGSIVLADSGERLIVNDRVKEAYLGL
jgi:branched-chain amino acid transport system ATP-binding protein